jgi:hypothetical protein
LIRSSIPAHNLVSEVPVGPQWYLLDGFPLAKGTEATPEDRLPLHVAECHTSTHLSTLPNTATNNLETIMASKISTTRVVSTTVVINQAMASRIIVEAEEVIVEDAAVVGSNETTTPTIKAEEGIIGTKK